MPSTTATPNPPRHGKISGVRSMIWAACLALALLICFVWGQMPTLQSEPLTRVGLFAALGLLSLPLVFTLPHWRGKRRIWLLVAAALALRAALFPAPVSDDVNRYLWEGRLVLRGENPYAAKAEDPVRAPYRDEFWAAMNHRNMSSVYPPGSQWLAAGAVAVAYHPWAFKALVCLGDLAVLALVIVLLRRSGSPEEWAGLYAFNPVILIAFAAEAHPDSLMMAAVCGMLLAAESGRMRLSWLLLGVAIQVKLVAVLLGPLLFRKDQVRHLWILVLMLLLPCLPFASAAFEWFSELKGFAGWSCYNSPLRGMLRWAGVPGYWVRLIAMGVMGAAVLSAILANRRGLPLRHASLTILGALIICAPFTHFWYVTWVIPLAALRPSLGWTVASITQAGYFMAWWELETHGRWGFGREMPLLIWLPALVAFFLQQWWLPGPIRRVFGKRKLFESLGTSQPATRATK